MVRRYYQPLYEDDILLECSPEDLREEITTLFYWILRAYRAYRREGWEEGASFEEVVDRLLDVTANRGLDAARDDLEPQVLRFLRDWEAKHNGKPPC